MEGKFGEEAATKKDDSTMQKTSDGEATANGGASSKLRLQPKADGVSGTGKAKNLKPTEFGKSDPLRDTILFLGFIGCLVLVTWGFADRKKDEGEDLTPSPSGMEELMKAMAVAAAKTRRKTPCDLFLDIGSIPGTGLSYFAGRDYERGDLLVEDVWLLPMGNNIHVSPSALMLKHHPLLANVQGTLHSHTSASAGTFKLHVSRPIAAGEELFVTYDAVLHKHAFYDRIPSAADYDLAGAIVADAMRTVTDHKGKKQRSSAGSVLRLLKRSVARLNHSLIATLIPDVAPVKNAKIYSASLALLRNQTLLKLQQSGVCLDDVRKAEDGASVAMRSFQKGQVVTTTVTLLLVMKKSEGTCAGLEGECSATQQRNCYEHELENDLILLCPLTSPTIKQAGDGDVANVEYRRNNLRAARELIGIDESPASGSSIMVWDVVALRNVAAGEEVRFIALSSVIPPTWQRPVDQHFAFYILIAHATFSCRSKRGPTTGGSQNSFRILARRARSRPVLDARRYNSCRLAKTFSNSDASSAAPIRSVGSNA